jgi:hypothetical protein
MFRAHQSLRFLSLAVVAAMLPGCATVRQLGNSIGGQAGGYIAGAAAASDSLQGQLPGGDPRQPSVPGRYRLVIYPDADLMQRAHWRARIEIRPYDLRLGGAFGEARMVTINSDELTSPTIIVMSPDDREWDEWLKLNPNLTAIAVVAELERLDFMQDQWRLEPLPPSAPPVSVVPVSQTSDATPATASAGPTTAPTFVMPMRDDLKLSLSKDRWLEPVMPIELSRHGVRVLPRDDPPNYTSVTGARQSMPHGAAVVASPPGPHP